MGREARVQISDSSDIVAARQCVRMLAGRLGFTGSEATLMAAATSEVARNILDYAQRGEMFFESVERGARLGLRITARDQGPGIMNLPQAMEYGFSTSGRTGAGLPGARWLMDEFDINSQPGEGTTITMTKWMNLLGKET
jgi:serine/threonine-protein kinase RsbT